MYFHSTRHGRVPPLTLTPGRWRKTRCPQCQSSWCGGICQGSPGARMCGLQSNHAGPVKQTSLKELTRKQHISGLVQAKELSLSSTSQIELFEENNG